MEEKLNPQQPMGMAKFFERARRLLPSAPKPIFIVIAVLVILAGGVTGYLLARGSSRLALPLEVAPGAKVEKEEIGLEDARTFRDETEGLLEKGGIDGEGTHHLVRPGGASQNVYLTSSVINLDDFVAKRVHVWGETHKGQKAGWLMDVGKLRIVE